MNWNDSLWFSPCYAIYPFRDLVQKIGSKKAFQKKKELEAYITGITLLGVNYSEKKLWWLQVPPNDPPDTLAATLTVNEKGIGVLNVQQVEIFQIGDYVQEEIWEAIARKLKHKAYDPKTTLIGLINKDTEIKDIRNITNQLKQIRISISSIWLIGDIEPMQNTYLAFQVWPLPEVYKIDVDKECQRLRQYGHVMRATRSTKIPTVKMTQIKRAELPKLIPNGDY